MATCRRRSSGSHFSSPVRSAHIRRWRAIVARVTRRTPPTSFVCTDRRDRMQFVDAPEVNCRMSGMAPRGFCFITTLAGVAIDRRYDQPATNGGNWFAFDWASRKLLCDGWQSCDAHQVPSE